jgi:hypothetical protein
MIGGQCVCRGGTVGDDCHVPTGKCRSGTHLEDGECVRDRKPRRKPTKSDKSDSPPAQSVPNFQIQIGPGFPGGSRGGKPGGGPPGGGPPKGGGCGKSCG